MAAERAMIGIGIGHPADCQGSGSFTERGHDLPASARGLFVTDSPAAIGPD